MTPQNRIVHYVLNNGECRPFLVTKAWSDVMVNGILFIDGSNDYGDVPNWTHDSSPSTYLTVWKTSIGYKDNSDYSIINNTWHWPEREE